MTDRQFLVWLKWMELDYNQPARTDWYLMQLTSVLAMANTKNPGSIRTNDFKMDFKVKRSFQQGGYINPQSKSKEDRESELAMSRWSVVRDSWNDIQEGKPNPHSQCR